MIFEFMDSIRKRHQPNLFDLIDEASLLLNKNRPIVAGVSFSVLCHLILLAIRFDFPDLRNPPPNPPSLEVVLVNSKTHSKPTKADLLAQANLDGGGNTDAARRVKTPFPSLKKENPSDLASATKQVAVFEQQTKMLLSQVQAKNKVVVANETPKETVDTPSVAELLRQGIDAAKLEAEIAKEIEAYQQRPKRRFVGARATEYRFARYVEDWRLKIERLGNLNYPAAARENKWYGSLVLTVSIRADGSLENVEINRSSGRKLLDAAAVRIVNLAAPFAPFSSDLRRDTDVLHITRTWTFTRDDVLEDSPGVAR